MVDTFLVPEKTVARAKDDSAPLDLSGAGQRVFLLTLRITDVIEQQALDVVIYGSSDGTTWPAKPLATFPQKFYRGQHPLLLDLGQSPEVKFLKAHWEVNRWGRGSDTPMFEFQVSLREVPADVLTEAAAEARGLTHG